MQYSEQADTDGSYKLFYENEDGSISSRLYHTLDGAAVIFKDVHIPCFHQSISTDTLEIEYCREGRLECRIGEEYVYVTPGDIIIYYRESSPLTLTYPTCHYHSVSLSIPLNEPSRILDLHLSVIGFTVDMLIKRYLPNSRRFSILKNSQLIAEVFKSMDNVPDNIKGAWYGMKFIEVLLLLSADIAEIRERHANAIPRNQADLAKKVFMYAMQNPDKHFSTEELAERFSISPTQLKKYFKTAYDMPIQQFIREQKIKAAAKLFELKGIGVTEASQMFGYSNPSKFTAAFKEVMGEYPSRYRSRHYSVKSDEEISNK